MSKKQTETETEAPPKMFKKKYLSPAQCKASAARISAEMKEDREGREKWGDQWAAYLYPPGTTATGENGAYLGKRGPKPLTLIWPGDMDQAKAAIEHLYHEDEAAVIIAALT